MENTSSEENRSEIRPETGGQVASSAPAINPYILPGSIVLASLIIAGALVYLVGSGSSDKAVVLENPLVPETAEAMADEVVLGDPNAPVLIVEYGDYQCPFCALFFGNVEPVIKEQYVNTGKAKFVFRNFAFLGDKSANDESINSAMAAECSKEQGKFWEYHDALYAAELADFENSQQKGVSSEHNGNLSRPLFMDIAAQLNLDTAVFAQCIDSNKYAEAIQEDNAQASSIGVSATPTTFIDGRMAIVIDASGNPIPGAQTGEVQSVGANGTAILNAIEAALQDS